MATSTTTKPNCIIYNNPEWGRFINADAFVSTGQGLLGNNMFVYCNNNPVNRYDPSGRSCSMVCFGDKDPFSAMFMGIGFGGGGGVGSAVATFAVVLLCVTIADTPDDIVQISFDEADVAFGPPSQNNNNDDDDDDEDNYDDDYYDDDSNFGGRKKMGKPKNNTPGSNKAQNKQFRDATKGLTKDQKQMVHHAVTGEDYGYHDIAAIAEDVVVLIMVCLGLEE